MVVFFIESAIGILLLYSVYYIIIRKGRGFQMQRFYLISAATVANVFPLLNIQLSSDVFLPSGQFMIYQETFSNFTLQIEEELHSHLFSPNYLFILKALYLSGVCFFIVRLIYYIIKPLKLIRKYGIEKRGNLKFIVSDAIQSPFSIFNFIFINRSRFLRSSLNKVVAHEEVHVSQKHTLDLLLVEVLLVFQWFNPVVYLLKRSLQEVHEYLADEGVLKRGFDPDSYIGLILGQVSPKRPFAMVCRFNSIIKKRIIMITNYKFRKKAGIGYLLILPVFALLFLAFSVNRDYHNTENSGFLASTMIIDFHRLQDASVPSIWPVDNAKCKITSGYGYRIHPIYREKMLHKGVDLAAKQGTPVVATADGMVEKTEYWPEVYGKYIVVVHNDEYTTLYAQLSEIKVKAGDRVGQGQVIGLVGSSGLSTAPHLHYEVRKNGEAVDPAEYFEKK